jgi:hypothetical protein
MSARRLAFSNRVQTSFARTAPSIQHQTRRHAKIARRQAGHRPTNSRPGIRSAIGPERTKHQKKQPHRASPSDKSFGAIVEVNLSVENLELGAIEIRKHDPDRGSTPLIPLQDWD